MSDPTSSTPKIVTQPKRFGFKRLIKTILVAFVLLVMAVGVSSYYLSFPFVWQAGLWSTKSDTVEERLSAIEVRIESELSNSAMGARVEQEIEQALTEVSSRQSQWRSESEAAIQQALETSSAQTARLSAAIDEISGKVSDMEREDRSQTDRLQEFNDRLDRFQASLQEMRAQVNVAQSAVESSLGRPVTEADVQDFFVNRGELIDAYWTVREIQELISKGSKTRALESFGALLAQWRQSTNQALNSLVPLMIQQQAVLDEWTPTQWDQWQALIQGWLGESSRWRLNGATDTSDDPASVSQPATQRDHQGWLARIRQVFSGIIKVRPRDVAALSARDQRLARANIEQRLLLLQVAVASQNVPSIRSQAASLASEIERLFDSSDTQAIRNGLEALSVIEDSPPPDVLGEVQQTIERALYQP